MREERAVRPRVDAELVEVRCGEPLTVRAQRDAHRRTAHAPLINQPACESSRETGRRISYIESITTGLSVTPSANGAGDSRLRRHRTAVRRALHSPSARECREVKESEGEGGVVKKREVRDAHRAEGKCQTRMQASIELTSSQRASPEKQQSVRAP